MHMNSVTVSTTSPFQESGPSRPWQHKKAMMKLQVCVAHGTDLYRKQFLLLHLGIPLLALLRW